MRVLFVSGELIGADLCYRLKKEGCDVRLFIEDESRKDCLDNMVEKTSNWEEELAWVGKDGLILFDDVGYGKIQDDLRAQGYLVVGGSAGGDKLERERQYANEIFANCGMSVVETVDFTDFGSAINFINEKKGKWVIKHNSHLSVFTYVGEMEDGRDVLNVLNNYNSFIKGAHFNVISLQQKVEGIEVGVSRYFNGYDWVGPIEINVEYKPLFNGGLGPQTGEMGTLMWYDNNEDNGLFKEVLSKLKLHLSDIKFKGDIDINCIVNESRAVPIEATARFGCPSTQLQSALHVSPWKDFLSSMAKGENYNLKYNNKFGIVLQIAIPPFPYKSINNDYYLKGVDILFKEALTEEEYKHLHFEEVSKRNVSGQNSFYISGSNGFILYVTGLGDSVQEARDHAYSIIKKIIIPKMFYRTDIGLNFINRDEHLLRKWGWI